MDYGDGQTQSYSFDAMGNRASKGDSSTGGESYSYDAANRLTDHTVGGTDYPVTPDSNGNTLVDATSSGESRFSTWDSQNRLAASTVFASSDGTSTTSAFTHGSDGLRRRGTVTTYATGEVGIGGPIGIGGGPTPLLHGSHPDLSATPVFAIPEQGTATGSTRTDYIYDGTMLVEQVIGHFTSSGTAADAPTTITYLQGPSGPLYRKSSAVADPSWYVYDGLGSVVGEVDVNGNVTASKLFDVYGLTRNVSGTPTTRQGFVGGLGHESDDETGLVYMRARYCDPSTGRFISEDPKQKGINWFAYCDDNPANGVDSSGNDFEDISSLLAWARDIFAQPNWNGQLVEQFCKFLEIIASRLEQMSGAWYEDAISWARIAANKDADSLQPGPIGVGYELLSSGAKYYCGLSLANSIECAALAENLRITAAIFRMTEIDD